MQVLLKTEKNALIVKLRGELDHHSTEQIRTGLEAAITKSQTKHLIFDFSELSFMDSAGIGMVIGRYKLIKALGGRVVLVCEGRMRKIAEMSGLSRIMTICTNMEQAALALVEG